MEMPRESLGVGLKPGDAHYRAYVGPPEDYDLIAAMTFNLLTTLGLRQHHSLLDVGCGSLRIGRLLIPYLNRGKYFGIEPNEWLVEEGIRRELGEGLVQIKDPTFYFWRFDCHIFDRRRRLSEKGLDLSGLCELSAGDLGTRSRRREFTIPNSGLETSQADVGAFWCTRF